MKKLRSTTPASPLVKAKRALLVFTAVVLAGLSTGYYFSNQSAFADQYDDRIRALQTEMNRYQAEANRLNAEALTLKVAIAQIVNQKNSIQAQIDVNQAKHDKLVVDIAATEKKIEENQDANPSQYDSMYNISSSNKSTNVNLLKNNMRQLV